jgi:bacillithiol system protein YtxJ
MSLQQLTTLDDLEAAIDASASRPVVVFKHSRTCGTSAMAYDEVAELLAGPGLPAHVHVVFVQASRSVSNAIEMRFGVRHESPQILVLHEGRVVWHASHFRVTASAIERAVAQVTASA